MTPPRSSWKRWRRSRLKAATPDIPILAKEIPSTANGEVAADGTSVTWKLLPGVKWSDGTPFTSDDVKATWQFIIKPESGATTSGAYMNIASIDTPDPTTAKINFKAPTAIWYCRLHRRERPGACRRRRSTNART